MNAEFIELTPPDMVKQRNHAMHATITTMVKENLITNEVAEKFLSEYTFVAVRKSSVLAFFTKLFKKDADDATYVFPLVKIDS